jgi:ATP-binding cassette subfamily B protein
VTTFRALARQGGGWLPLLGIADLCGTLVTLALPVVLGHVIDALVAGEQSRSWFALAGALISVAVLADLASAFAQPVCVARTTAWLRNRLVRHVFAIGPEGARRFATGDLVSRVSGNAVDAAQAGPGLVNTVTSVLPPVGSLVLLAYLDGWLAVAFLGGLALVACVLVAFARRTTAAMTTYQQLQGRIAGALAESLAGARTIAAAGTVEREERRVLEPLAGLRAEGMKMWLVLARSSAQAAVVGPLVLVAVLAAAGLELLAGRISPGELFAAGQYAVIGAGLGGLTGVFGQLARARAAARRAEEVLGVPPVPYGPHDLPPGSGQLVFLHVTARAEDGTTLVDGIDLALPAGAAIAVVGRSGAGKSVLAALAARLREPDEGQIILDGVPLDLLTHAELRAAVGCAFERPVLVGATVADAIGLGLPADRVRAAARATRAHDFVSRLPEGYDTPLADAPMSGGEAQRIGLARAWNAGRLLVLDDATSSLDMVTELQIGQALTSDRDRRTRLVVTHRGATAARADLVVWLDEGRVLGVGTHQQLWTAPAYREVFG